ncbi:MAG: chemotaxis protein [Pseudomonas sp.]|uniref:LysE family translocator n=2 Tax=Pseudomonadaceae TaxID=135621 RepID=UPI001196D084|nr:LysE family transporter [Pseudomonas aeruginosa]QUN70786.1 LysE family transporter [Pseudomonas sp. JS425]TVT64907.1 MAG: chemotaxis protein [Pseudomonas sp.]
MTELFIYAFVLGLLFNAMPGAIFTESLRRGMRGGFRPALDVQIGSLAGDFIWAVLGLLGAAALFTIPYVEKPLAIVGAILLGWIAWQALLDGLSPMPTFDPSSSTVGGRSAVTTGAALSLTNPQNITYWTGLGGTITALGVANPGWTAFAVFLVGFMASSVLWCFICAGAIAWTRRFIGPRTWTILNIGCAVGIAYFAGLVLFRTLG